MTGLAGRPRRVAGIMDRVGASADGRVGSVGWNTANHTALYFGVPSTGRVLHSLNIRLFPEQLIYTVEHAEDEGVAQRKQGIYAACKYAL